MLPSRKTARLTDYDYAQPGAYFVTVCTARRQLLFGDIHQGRMCCSSLGFLADKHLRGIAKHYDNVALDAWVVMPNHVHMTLLIHRAQPGGRLAGSLSAIVGGYKSGVSSEARRLNLLSGLLWQPRYHDHVIRHERALERVREYVASNPRQWELDRENAAKSGEAEFYRWMESYTRAASRDQSG